MLPELHRVSVAVITANALLLSAHGMTCGLWHSLHSAVSKVTECNGLRFMFPVNLPFDSPLLVTTGLWLARNEEMDLYSSPYKTHYTSFHFLFHSFIPSEPKARLFTPLGSCHRTPGPGLAQFWPKGVGRKA